MADVSDRELLLEMRGDLKEVRRQVTATNGRVTRLEDWRRERELAEAEARGRAEVAASVVLTKAQVAGMTAAIGFVGAVAGVVARYWP